MKILKNIFISSTAFLFLLFGSAQAQRDSYVKAAGDSARSDIFTGGTIEKAALVPGAGNLEITVNVPAFQLTLWQNEKEIKTYWIGVGLKDYPIYIGRRDVSSVIWNPSWIVPASSWVKGFKAGAVIKPTDRRNPLGKLKIPLGGGYLIHQAKGTGDLGNLVSHGCVRMLKSDLYDLAEKIVAARALPVSQRQINAAKTGSRTLQADLDPIIPVEITYDPFVVEAGNLHIYPDVYDFKVYTVEDLREELKANNVDVSEISDSTLQKMIARAAAKKQFVVSLESIREGRELSGGRLIPVVSYGAEKNAKRKPQTARRRK